jgi:hypothetical protein
VVRPAPLAWLLEFCFFGFHFPAAGSKTESIFHPALQVCNSQRRVGDVARQAEGGRRRTRALCTSPTRLDRAELVVQKNSNSHRIMHVCCTARSTGPKSRAERCLPALSFARRSYVYGPHVP